MLIQLKYIALKHHDKFQYYFVKISIYLRKTIFVKLCRILNKNIYPKT